MEKISDFSVKTFELHFPRDRRPRPNTYLNVSLARWAVIGKGVEVEAEVEVELQTEETEGEDPEAGLEIEGDEIVRLVIETAKRTIDKGQEVDQESEEVVIGVTTDVTSMGVLVRAMLKI